MAGRCSRYWRRLRIDLIVLDINLPDIDGLEVCRQLRARSDAAYLPIVHLSATFVTNVDKAQGLSAGADSYLTHPADPAVLVATVRALLFTLEQGATGLRAIAVERGQGESCGP